MLREYDIRGIVGKTLHPADALRDRPLLRQHRRRAPAARTVAVGYDGRLSSPELEAALVDGLTASGMEVLRIGRGPTPMLYYAADDAATDGAVMVTGSHNPPDYNGFKMMLGGKPFFGAQIAELGAHRGRGRCGAEAAAGSVATGRVADDYVARLLARLDGGDRALKVVWDNGNGAAGEVLQRLVAKLPGPHTVLFAEIDGRFPNHHPDPTVPKNLEPLIAEVRARGADLGIAFDGDADRIGVVDDNGQILFGDQLMVLLARDVLRTQPGATIIADVKASQVLFDEIARAGGTPLMWKTGHSLIKAKMAEIGCAARRRDVRPHLLRRPLVRLRRRALCRACGCSASSRAWTRSLSAIRDALPQVVNTPELRFDCDDDAEIRGDRGGRGAAEGGGREAVATSTACAC